jgi:hypothetical protein
MLALSVGSTAYGYWTGPGGGNGSATTGAAAALTLTPGSADAGLYPGGVADVVVTVSNPSATPVQIGSLSRDPGQGTSGFAVDSGHSGCDVSALSFTTDTNAGSGWTVPADVGGVDGTLPITLTDALMLGEDAANSCQGATVTVYLTAGP